VYGHSGEHVGDDRAVGSSCAGRRRPYVRTATLTAALACLALALLECAVEERTLGAACVKGEDCLSWICSDQVCVAAPPLLDAEPPFDAGLVEGSVDAAVDSAKPPRDAKPSPDVSIDMEAAAPDASDGAKEAFADHAPTDGTSKDDVTSKDAKGSGD
jgi:hypothetical protein